MTRWQPTKYLGMGVEAIRFTPAGMWSEHYSKKERASMRDGKESQTAQYVAFCRALETAEKPARRLFRDPLALALLSGLWGRHPPATFREDETAP